jgi:hypothetical protein
VVLRKYTSPDGIYEDSVHLWEFRWHEFIDALADGKDIEGALATIA